MHSYHEDFPGFRFSFSDLFLVFIFHLDPAVFALGGFFFLNDFIISEDFVPKRKRFLSGKCFVLKQMEVCSLRLGEW